jgi:hypothetical protein
MTSDARWTLDRTIESGVIALDNGDGCDGLVGPRPIGLPSHADHELPKPPPLWSPLDDVERLALIEVPAGMAQVPAGPFSDG